MFTKKPEKPEKLESEMSTFESQKPITKTTSKAVGGPTQPAGSGPLSSPMPAAPSMGMAPKTAMATPAYRADRMAPSIIGEDLTVTGNVLSKGEVQVDGQIQGDVHCSSLIVDEKAQITGGIVAEDVVVRGQVMGSIRGVRVTLQSSSHVEGDIFHQSLAIEQGAFFEGKSRRTEDPIASAPKIDLLQGQAAE